MHRKNRTPWPRDREAGAAVRYHRLLQGLSLEELAERVGITFQQLQKYERGANRISIGRLYQLAEALEVPVYALLPNMATGQNESQPASKELLCHMRSFSAIANLRIRQELAQLTRALAEQSTAT